MTLEEGNELIAKFICSEAHPKYNPTEYEMYGVLPFIPDGEDERHFFMVDEMEFHTSWDWLMPVVEKIEDIGYVVSIIGGNCEIGGVKCSIRTGVKIDSTWTCVVEFILWYNERT